MKLVFFIFFLFMAMTAHSATWKKVAGGVSTQVCPVGYVFVPALAGYTTIDFCIAKYEMKDDGYGMPISQAAGLPWTTINRPTARAKCKALGTGFDMISNDQWQTVARNIAGVASNWSNNAAASGELNRGHTDSVPNNTLAASTDDTDGCNGTGNLCTGGTSGTWSAQKRTHKLSNGNVVWDLAGNVWEWTTNDSDTSNGADGYVSAIQDASIRQTRYGALTSSICAAPGASPYCGMGGMYVGYTGGAIVRGGLWQSDVVGGVFASTLQVGPAFADVILGFRCVFIP